MHVVFDLFPARVRVAPERQATDTYVYEELTVTSPMEQSRLVDRVRIVLTEKTVMIAADSSSGPVLIFKEKYLPETFFHDKKKKTGRVTTEHGKVLVFEKDANCGCGSALRGWNPYRTVYSTKDPIE
jgi:hypothetical protein